MEEKRPRKIQQVSFAKISVEAAVQDPCVRLSAQGVYRRSPQKIFVRDLKVRSWISLGRLLARHLDKISGREFTRSKKKNYFLCKRPLGKFSPTDLSNRSLCTVSVHDLHKTCPGKISVQNLYKRFLCEIFEGSLYKLCMRASLRV